MRIIFLFVVSVIWASAASAEWLEAKTRHFEVYSEGTEKSLRAFAGKIERFDTFLRQYYKVTDDEEPLRLKIYLLPNADAVAELVDAGDRGVAGVYLPRMAGSFAVAHRERSDEPTGLDANEVLFHEYAHHFMIHFFPKAYPAWYVEGFAEYLSTTDFTKEGRAKVGVPAYHRAFGLLLEKTIPAERLLNNSAWDFSADERDSYYGRSWLLVHFLTFTPERQGQLAQYLLAINSGKSGLDAARDSFGDFDRLDGDLKAYLNKSKMTSIIRREITPEPTDIIVTALSAGASAILPHQLRLMKGVDAKATDKIIASLQKATKSFPDDPQVWHWLAEAYIIGKNDVEADKAVGMALKLDPNLSRTLLRKGQISIRNLIRENISAADKWKTARSWIVKANRANVNDPMPLFAYYQSWHDQGLPPTAPSLDGLARAFEIVPEAGDLRISYATSLANRKEFDAAIRVMEVLAFSPHEDENTKQARTMIDDLREAKKAHSKVKIDTK